LKSSNLPTGDTTTLRKPKIWHLPRFIFEEWICVLVYAL
jgi:hypothetical protein